MTDPADYSDSLLPRAILEPAPKIEYSNSDGDKTEDPTDVKRVRTYAKLNAYQVASLFYNDVSVELIGNTDTHASFYGDLHDSMDQVVGHITVRIQPVINFSVSSTFGKYATEQQIDTAKQLLENHRYIVNSYCRMFLNRHDVQASLRKIMYMEHNDELRPWTDPDRWHNEGYEGTRFWTLIDHPITLTMEAGQLELPFYDYKKPTPPLHDYK